MSPSVAKIMNTITDAAERVAKLEPQLREARKDLHEAIRAGAAAGVDHKTLAKLSGLTRQRIEQLVDKTPDA